MLRGPQVDKMQRQDHAKRETPEERAERLRQRAIRRAHQERYPDPEKPKPTRNDAPQVIARRESAWDR